MGMWGDWENLCGVGVGIFFYQDHRRTSAEEIPGTECHPSSVHSGSSWRILSLEVIYFPQWEPNIAKRGALLKEQQPQVR